MNKSLPVSSILKGGADKEPSNSKQLFAWLTAVVSRGLTLPVIGYILIL